MNFKQQVCTAEQAFKLKELGVAQKSFFRWYEVADGTESFSTEVEDINWENVLTYYDRTRDVAMSIEKLDGDMVTSDGEFGYTKDVGSAFTVAELGVTLPNESGVITSGSQFNAHTGQWQAWSSAIDGDGMDRDIETKGDTEAESRAELLIKLLEIGRISPAEVNARLQQ